MNGKVYGMNGLAFSLRRFRLYGLTGEVDSGILSNSPVS